MVICLGAVVMAFGGSLSFSDRRLRVGAPTPARLWGRLRPAAPAAPAA
jgi:cytochrome c-type biogenesis protein CcmF